MTITAITELTAAAGAYAKARDLLAERKQTLDDQVEATHRRFLPGIKTAAAVAIEMRAALAELLQKHSSEFAAPRKRTITAHGIKLGFQQTKPAVAVENEARTIALIEKLLTEEQAETLIATKKSLVKPAVANLDAKDLRRIGASLTPARDQVVIKSATDDLDKIIDALLKRAATEEEAAA